MLMKHEINKVNINIYDIDIIIVFTDDIDVYLKTYDLLQFASDDINAIFTDKCAGITFYKDAHTYYIVFEKYPTVGIIAHEAVHCINFVFNCMGQIADYENDELYAYHVGWLTNTIYDMQH